MCAGCFSLLVKKPADWQYNQKVVCKAVEFLPSSKSPVIKTIVNQMNNESLLIS
jgi:hypothetical protein